MAKVRTNFRRKPVRHFIKQWRLFRGLTQEQLAERAGVTHGALSQLERGLVNYTQPMLESLAEALNCEPADLIMRDPNSEVWSILDTLQKATEPEQRQIVAVVAALRRAN